MKKLLEYWPNISRVLQLIAVAFLLYKVLQPSGQSARLQKIEDNQVKILTQQAEINKSLEVVKTEYALVNKAIAKRIDSLTNNINKNVTGASRQIKSLDKLVRDLKANQPLLPDPDK